MRPVSTADNFASFVFRLFRNSWSLNLLESKGLSWSLIGYLYLYRTAFIHFVVCPAIDPYPFPMKVFQSVLSLSLSVCLSLSLSLSLTAFN